MVREKNVYLKLKAGIRTALADGSLVYDSPMHMTTEILYRAYKGDTLTLQAPGFVFAPALFSMERPEQYLYSYAYQKECNWTTYLKNLTPDSYSGKKYYFEDDCYFRVCVKRLDKIPINEQDIETGRKLLLFSTKGEVRKPKLWFKDEIEKTIQEIQSVRSSDSVVLGLLADTHYTVNGTFEDTIVNINCVEEQVGFDGIVHLGDLTDGILSKEATKEYAYKVIRGLKKTGKPLYITVGNHDTNYFMNNPCRFTQKEQAQFYCGRQDKPYYYIDINEKLRCLFLSSFDASCPIRYGFDNEELLWVRETLNKTPKGRKVVVFCHDAPLAQLDFFSIIIRNGDRLMDILEEYNQKQENHIMAYFHGHTHGDYVYQSASFPIISIGCNKCEYFTDKKPDGFQVAPRKPDTVTQDLWDVMLLDPNLELIRLIRFGAGANRMVDCRKKPDTRCAEERERKQKRKIEIWGHRGLSGYAPENTIPAFELAVEIGVDGIELDVQMSKDGELVIIHDETIDRTSDGTGYVKDYTMEELKQFNFAKRFPAFGRVTIPTLSEVYHCLKNTSIAINLELKNNLFFYEGMEEKVWKLTKEMGMEERLLFSSFNHYSMKRMKKIDVSARIAFLYSDGYLHMGEYASKYGACAIHPVCRNLHYPGVVEECHKSGIKVNVWTVNKKEDFDLAVGLGADAIISDFPERFL